MHACIILEFEEFSPIANFLIHSFVALVAEYLYTLLITIEVIHGNGTSGLAASLLSLSTCGCTKVQLLVSKQIAHHQPFTNDMGQY